MPFNSGIFSLVSTYKGVPGKTIRTENHNQPLEDIANGLSSVVTRDGTSSMVASLNMGGFKVINLAPGSASTDAATVGQIQSASPIGIVSDFAGATAPAGWLLCYGQAISRTTYAALFAVIGTTYGAGDGSTTFNVPDCRDVAIVGRGNMGGTARGLLSKFASATLGALFGVQEHTLTVAQMPAHPHTFTGSPLDPHGHDVGASYIGSGTSSNGGYILPTGTGARTTAVSAGTPTGTISSAGGDQAHPNVQPSLVMSKIIRATY